MPTCDEAAQEVLRDVFGFHPHAIRSCVERTRLPIMHAHADHVFIVLHTPEPGRAGHVHYVELDQFASPRYLVTVHGPVDPAVGLRETAAVLDRLQRGRLHPATALDLSYAIVSLVVDDDVHPVDRSS